MEIQKAPQTPYRFILQAFDTAHGENIQNMCIYVYNHFQGCDHKQHDAILACCLAEDHTLTSRTWKRPGKCLKCTLNDLRKLFRTHEEWLVGSHYSARDFNLPTPPPVPPGYEFLSSDLGLDDLTEIFGPDTYPNKDDLVFYPFPLKAADPPYYYGPYLWTDLDEAENWEILGGRFDRDADGEFGKKYSNINGWRRSMRWKTLSRAMAPCVVV